MTLQGSLRDMALPDLIRVFRTSRKTGELGLTSATERGVIYVAEGCLLDAIVTDSADDTVIAIGDDAVLYLLTWEDATFIFVYNPSVRTHPMNLTCSGQHLVFEGIRRHADPLHLLSYYNVDWHTQLQLCPGSHDARKGIHLDVNQWRVLSQTIQRRRLCDIHTATGIPRETMMRIVVELLTLGLVEVPLPTTLPLAQRSLEDTSHNTRLSLSDGDTSHDTCLPLSDPRLVAYAADTVHNSQHSNGPALDIDTSISHLCPAQVITRKLEGDADTQDCHYR